MKTGQTIASRKRYEAQERALLDRLANAQTDWTATANSDLREAHQRYRSSESLIGNFLSLLANQRRAVAVALGALTVATVLAMVPPAATKVLVDYVLADVPFPERWIEAGLPTDRWRLLMLGVGGVFVVSLIRAGLQTWGLWLATRASKRVQLAVRKRLFEHTIRLPLHRIYHLKSGGVSSILRMDVNAVGELVMVMLYHPWRAVVQLIGSLCVLAWVDWRLLLGASLAIPVIYLTHRSWIARIRPREREVRRRRRELDALATEAFGGIRVVRAFSRLRTELLRYMSGSHLVARKELHIWWISRQVAIVWAILVPAASAALLLFGGGQVLEGNLTLGDLMMFLVFMLMLLDPLAVLASSAASFQNGLSALDRVMDLLEEPQEIRPASDARQVNRQQISGRISFQGVSFRYPHAEKYALRDATVEIEPGMMLALVGPSGSGKTTMCNLVARFYNPTQGRICLDGVDLREYDVDSFRRLLGVVEQDVFLFDGTVAENIGYADRSARANAIQRAAAIANADEFIRELPRGYDTIIGERGVKLSGGQRQRLAIARAVLADPRILILDEATSNLDTRSEQLIQESINALTADRTTLVIAHRLSTVTHADRIVVLVGGVIRQIGTHADLMAAKGVYREMIQAQINLYGNIPDDVKLIR